MSKKIYEMAFKLNAKLGNSYNSTFSKAESIASSVFNKISNIASSVFGDSFGNFNFSSISNTYKEFQQSLANTSAIAGISKGSKEFNDIEKAARDAGKATSKTAKESEEAIGYMKLASWEIDDCIKNLMPFLRFSEAMNSDLATTADLITDSMSSMGVEISELTKYLDIAAAANNTTNLTGTMLMETYIGAGGMFKMLGTSMEEAAAISGVLADKGIKGTEAGTSLNSILINLMGNTRASGIAFDELGISAYTTEGKFRGITTVLKDIDKALEGASDKKIGRIAAKLGGKTQMDTFTALLSGVKLEANGNTKLDNLINKYKDSEGALEKMAETMRDTYSGALAILESASDEVKIQLMEQIEPSLTPIIRMIADDLPNIGSKASKFINSLVKKINNFYKSAKPVFTWLSENFNIIKIGITGIGGAFVAAKISSKVNNIITSIKSLLSVIKINPIGLFAAGFGAIVTVLGELERQAKNSSLEKHFGNIALSIEQIDIITEHILNTEKFKKLGELLDIHDNLKNTQETINDYAKTIEKLNFKVNMGIELTIDEQEQYRNAIDNYIKEIQNYINESWQLDNMLFEGNTTMTLAINSFYLEHQEEFAKLGSQLQETVTEAFNDGLLTIEEAEKIAQLKSQIAEIQNDISKGISEKKIELLAKDVLSGDVTADSFKDFIENMNLEIENIKQESIETTALKLATIEKLYNSGKLNNQEYIAQKSEAEEKRDNDIVEIEWKAIEYINEIINKKYPEQAIEFQKNRTRNSEGKINPLETVSDFIDGKYISGDYSAYLEFIKLANPIKNDFNTRIENVNPKLKSDIINTKEQEELDKIYGTNGNIISLFETNPQLKLLSVLSSDKSFIENISEFTADSLASVITKIDENEMLQKSKLQTEKNKQKIELHKKTIEDFYNSEASANIPRIMKTNIVATEAIKEVSEKPINITVPTNVKTIMNNLIEKPITENRNIIKEKYEEPINTVIPTSANTILNTHIAEKSIVKNRNIIKEKCEEPMNTTIPTTVELYAKNIDISRLKGPVASAIKSASIALGINCYASGTESTPDTFIAGEKGAELITGARGKKVFNALETSNIFSNIGKIKDTLVASVFATRTFNNKINKYKQDDDNGIAINRATSPLNNNNSSIDIHIHNDIKIDGLNNNDSNDLKKIINEAIEQNNSKIINSVISILNQNKDRRFRLSNE